jgi:hypothetical protein
MNYNKTAEMTELEEEIKNETGVKVSVENKLKGTNWKFWISEGNNHNEAQVNQVAQYLKKQGYKVRMSGGTQKSLNVK